jgi:F1F0 ATPase subunit 2
MHEPFLLIVALLAGGLLGVVHFGGLRITLDYLPRVTRRELLLVGSFLVRVALCLGGFYLVMGGHWERLLACMLGFMVIRHMLVRRWQPRGSGASAVR